MNPAPKVITGRLHPDNKAACDWGFQGFLAYGCHGYTVVIDPKTLQIIQTVGPQKGKITCVRWISEDYHHAFATGSTYSLHLACADTSGSVIIWDVTTGQVRSQLIHSQPGKGFVLGMEWIRGHSESNDLLLILRGPDILEMWDGFSGVKLWKKCFTDNILSFSLDPFSMDRLVLLSESPQLLVCTDICTIKEPSDNYTVIPFSDPNPSIPAAGSKRKLPSNSSSSSSLAKMASLASNMILSSTSEQLRKRSSVVEEEYLTSCIQATCSAAHQHLVLLVFASEIQMHDIDVGMVISTIRLDKSSPNFTKVIACQTVDMLFCLHDNGSASVRVRKQTNSARQKKLSCTDTMLDMTYELRCQSDSLRLLHHSKVFSFNFNPVSEKQMALLLSDSRLIILDIVMTNYSKPQEMLRRNLSTTLADVIAGTEVVSLPSMCKDTQDKITLQLVTSGLVSGVMSPVTIVTMLPAAGDNHAVDVQMALGSESGCIQLVNVYSGQVEHEYKLFMWPVRGIECIDHQRLLVYTYPDPPSYGNRKIKTDLITLDIKSGRTFCFFEGHEGKGPILMTTISPSRLYVAVVYKDKAMELWNINTRQLVREMILDVLVKPVHATWYNMVSTLPKNQSLMDNNGHNKTVEKRVVVEQLFVSGLLADNSSIVRIAFHDGIMAKINLFPMDMLFGTQSGRVEIVCMTYQSHYLVLADRVGQLYITDAYQTDKGAKKIQERRGFEVVAIKFAPGKMNMCFMVQYTDSIIIWELIVDKLNAAIVTSNPPLSCELVSATWAGPESVVMATEDGCLHVMDISNKMPSSPDITDKDDFFHVKDISMKQTNSPISKWKLPAPIFSLALLEPKLAFLLKYSLQTNIQPFHPSVQQYMDLIDRDVVKYIQDETTSVVDRCYTVASEIYVTSWI